MSKLKSTWSRVRALAAPLLAPRDISKQVRAERSLGSQQQEGTFYEFRTYSIKPAKMIDFLKLTKDNIHLRTAHSELIGYWSADLGGLNEVFHIWKYDNYSQRSGVRAALAKEKEWQENYISKMLPMLVNQSNEVNYMVPWSKLIKPPKEGVYELVSYQMKPGGPAVWGQAFQRALNSHANVGYCSLIGVFHTEFGLLNKVHALWWYENADSRASGRHIAHNDSRVVAAVRDSAVYLVNHSNKLLIPTPYSPLK
ncbi:protein NipSnap homolog 3A [Callorhinchus milii]|uniref:Nipsnap homolog 3A (C. elegans) n=1 Tax=Callorhinchus milii TaxID=7868 RepID=A0A4W3JLU0_CALMI|nr:protein NipSnap homolog 3A [Callorhinchus milii]|eukprot:gi/632949541/ref/XP_007890213.1/ PREDICTED: protein NipSnap homolog 3A [Callorhinchus milii]